MIIAGDQWSTWDGLWVLAVAYWWVPVGVLVAIGSGIAAMWDALIERVRSGGRRELPSKHLRREITRRDRELVRLRGLLAEVAELDAIADPLDPRAVTLPTELSRRIAEEVGDEELRAVEPRRRK